MLFLLLLVSVSSGLFFYVKAFKAGLNAKKWAFAGVLMGPTVFPMFSISRHIAWRRSTGFNNLYLAA